MQTRKIGSLDVTVVGLGCNNFGGRIDGPATDAVVGAALDAGINFFDTADIYGGTLSEELLGQALGHRRDEIVLATKFGIPYEGHPGGASAASTKAALEASLRRLGTDRVDLYQLHYPDKDVPIAETIGAMAELVAEGKVKEIGCSNFSVEMLDQADRAARDLGVRGFVSVQNEYNVLHREPEAGVLEACAKSGVAFLPFFPLASGLLSGKYRRGEPPPEGTRLAGLDEKQRQRQLSDARLDQVRQLEALAASEGHTVGELAIAWLRAHEVVASVIAGATRPEQVHANVAAADWELSSDLMAAVNAIAPA
jgi:aryl-alcohol dehydrogenase-like predicted oxidoreductase